MVYYIKFSILTNYPSLYCAMLYCTTPHSSKPVYTERLQKDTVWCSGCMVSYDKDTTWSKLLTVLDLPTFWLYYITLPPHSAYTPYSVYTNNNVLNLAKPSQTKIKKVIRQCCGSKVVVWVILPIIEPPQSRLFNSGLNCIVAIFVHNQDVRNCLFSSRRQIGMADF